MRFWQGLKLRLALLYGEIQQERADRNALWMDPEPYMCPTCGRTTEDGSHHDPIYGSCEEED